MTLDLYSAADQLDEADRGTYLGKCETCGIVIYAGNEDVFLDGDRGDFYHKRCVSD